MSMFADRLPRDDRGSRGRMVASMDDDVPEVDRMPDMYQDEVLDEAEDWDARLAHVRERARGEAEGGVIGWCMSGCSSCQGYGGRTHASLTGRIGSHITSRKRRDGLGPETVCFFPECQSWDLDWLFWDLRRSGATPGIAHALPCPFF